MIALSLIQGLNRVNQGHKVHQGNLRRLGKGLLTAQIGGKTLRALRAEVWVAAPIKALAKALTGTLIEGHNRVVVRVKRKTEVTIGNPVVPRHMNRVWAILRNKMTTSLV
jgi:hypothetical protein